MHQSSLAVALVRKLVAVLESTERLPVIAYDHGGGGSGLQVSLLFAMNSVIECLHALCDIIYIVVLPEYWRIKTIKSP